MAHVYFANYLTLAEIEPGETHTWLFDPSGWDPSDYVIQATAGPQPFHAPESLDKVFEGQVEVTKFYLLRKGSASIGAVNECQINVWVTNIGTEPARYNLNLSFVSP
jgi:hypothetical protein